MTFNRNCLGAQCWNGVDLALKNVKSTLFQWAQRVEIPSTQRHDSKSWRWTNVESTIVDSSSRRNNVESYLLSLFINILVCSSSMYKGYVKTTRLQSEHTWDIYCTCTNIFFFFFLIWVLWPFQEYFTYIEPIVHRRWRKPENPEKNHLTIRKQNLAFPHMTRARLEPQRWET